jgi:lysyl-tRNA synthetase class 2
MAWARHGGLTALEFGDESVLEVGTFTLDGREMRNVRQAVSRAERSGAQVTVRRLGDVPDEEVEQLRDLCDLWRGMREERGFSMSLGRLDAVRDPRSVVVVAHVEDHPRALLSLVPWGSDGLSLDLMRRDPHAPSGINELMIARLMSASPTLGVRQVSLNFAPFREAIERSERFGAPPGTRLWGRTLRMVSSASQADSLYRFNAKFRPEWRRRFLVYPPAVGLPRVTLAYLRAEGMLPTVRRPDAVLPLPRAAGSPVDAAGADAAGVDAASVDVAGVDAAGVDVDQQSGGGA